MKKPLLFGFLGLVLATLPATAQVSSHSQQTQGGQGADRGRVRNVTKGVSVGVFGEHIDRRSDDVLDGCNLVIGQGGELVFAARY